MIDNCPLCLSKANEFYNENDSCFLICSNCAGIFRHHSNRLSSTEELKHYNTHNNDIKDLRYQAFVSPITNSIRKFFSPDHKGLDFGAGAGPVVQEVLNQFGYQVNNYDPYYHPEISVLASRYDFISCCEVVEHFYNPKNEFELLNSILNSDGKLFIMTELYKSEINFDKWYYKNDPTHVFFYQAVTMEFIMNYFNYKSFDILGRLTILSK